MVNKQIFQICWYFVNLSGNRRVSDVITAVQLKMSLFFIIIFNSLIFSENNMSTTLLHFWWNSQYREPWRPNKKSKCNQVSRTNQQEVYDRKIKLLKNSSHYDVTDRPLWSTPGKTEDTDTMFWCQRLSKDSVVLILNLHIADLDL